MAVSRKVALLTALACTKRLGLPQLPPALWQKVRLFLDHDLHDLCADDPEGVFELKPRGAPVAGRVGQGSLRFSLRFVGCCMSAPHERHSYKNWSSHPTTCSSLPTAIADVVAPGWQSSVGLVTRLCCELSYQHTRYTVFGRQSVHFCPVTDWHGLANLDHHYCKLSNNDAYVFYFSMRCRRSLGYSINRLGQLQAQREEDVFHVKERQRSIGYGCKEYDYSEQIRSPSFNHMPVVLVALDCECHCGATSCGAGGMVNFTEVRNLSEKLKCPLVLGTSLASWVDPESSRKCVQAAFDALTAECHRLNCITQLTSVRVPRYAQVQPELHLGATVRRLGAESCRVM
mmetsp:Transcript_103260/g.182010  ORF Transcript_103260/g.182010 Transcript_103260/m.182010 type:complete len:344 (-) Transcript_103260:77-1108(-)